MPTAAQRGIPALELIDAELAYGRRVLWSGLDLAVRPGEFVAVLGANGSGKTSLVRAVLGEQPLTRGEIRICGEPAHRGSNRVGYVPQRVTIDSSMMIKARDVVQLGIDGHRWGPGLALGARRRRLRAKVDGLLESVGATAFAQAPVSMLSGGELQRIRVAAALASDPVLLLCDEPLAALDLGRQREVASLVDEQRRRSNTAVLFITHEINAVLDYVDRVLYLAGGRFRLGTPDEVMNSASLTELYGAPVDVVKAHGRVVVVAANDMMAGIHQSLDDHALHDPDLHDHGWHDPHQHWAGPGTGGGPRPGAGADPAPQARSEQRTPW